MALASRRAFLVESAAALGAATAALAESRSRAATPPKGFPGFPGVELAIATICVDGFANKHHEPAFAAIPELGFANVEFNLWYADTITPAYFDGLRKRCDQRGLTPISVQGNSYGFEGADGLIKDVSHKMALLDGCRRLGCRIIKCTGARRGTSGGVEAVIQTLRELVPLAEQEGVLLTLENHAGNVLERPEDYDRIFTAIDSPNVGMCLDTGHFEGIGADLGEVVDRFGPRILQADLKDCRARGQGHDTVVFGEGVTDFDAFLQRLMDAGFTGYLVIEQAWNEPRGDWKADLQSAYRQFCRWERRP